MIYLDNAATTRPSRKAMKVAREVLENEWFNPSSLYDDASKVAQKIKRSRQIIADIVGVKSSEITFTSGASEGNNMILNDPSWDNIITLPTEHNSVYNTALNQGVKTKLVDVNTDGKVDLIKLEEVIESSKGKTLVSVMSVNNEIGTIQPTSKIAELVHSRPDCYLHVDATQSMGKLPLNLKGADYITASAHKFHGLKGVGFIAHRKPITPMITGGHQESGLRAGTENVHGILSMAEALQEASDNEIKNLEWVLELRDRMLCQLTTIEHIRINSDPNNPYILNISFKDVNAESLLHLLSLKGVYVSSGSACNSKETKVSRILQCIKVPEDYIYGTIRISFSADNLVSEIDEATEFIINSIATIRKMKG